MSRQRAFSWNRWDMRFWEYNYRCRFGEIDIIAKDGACSGIL